MSVLFVGPVGESDKYRLIEPRSEGAEGMVWRGELHLDSMVVPVAVKVINPENIPDLDRWRQRWHRQAELLRSLDHPGLVSVREVFEGPSPHEAGSADESDPTLCLVMNWVEGPTLAEWVAQRPNRDPVESLRVIASLAAAVDYLHTFGDGTSPILHRDIKPPNVIMTASGPKLVDFGFARALDGQASMTMVTTPRFTAPEVAAGLGYSEASDRYALGATAYYALTGHSPTIDDPETMRDRLDNTPGLKGRRDIQESVLTMLAPNPNDRPTSPVEWAQSMAMASIIGTHTIITPTTTPTTPQTPTPKATTEPKPINKRAIGIAAAITLTLGITAIIAQSLSNTPDTAEGLARATTTLAPPPTTQPTTTTTITATTVDPRVALNTPPAYGQTVPGNGAGFPALGSGCVPLPQGTTVLPDGFWFGYVVAAETTPGGGGGLEFDLACFYEGSVATAEAAHDRASPSNGIYVRNRNPQTFHRAVWSSATVYWLGRDGLHRETTYLDWLAGSGPDRSLICPSQSCGVWIDVRGGQIAHIQEQADR